ncbi:glycosyltransferase family 4 protein [Actinomadura sp. PM05-2]|uniref:Glycosyltransferase family 4 protein n=2 Tax=Actinomadura parmotrematis TaxID=2864039 RepID=A0ABS7G4B4_9ACTN|nr:glycosyltransferase family 4 protein [Actinomadura parmotrematis]MBW8487566.1 glycosyltransferase family 4 protein [Actinomadura parmotrematis]
MVNWRDPWQEAAGGAEEYAWQMSLQLRDRGARVTYVTSREPGQARRETRDGVRIARMGGKYSRYPAVTAWLARHRRDFDAAVDCMNGIPFFAALVLPRRTRVLLLVHHVHGRQFFVYFPFLAALFGKSLEGPVARRAYRARSAVAVSASTADAMRTRLGWRGPIYIVPNGSRPLPLPPGGAVAQDGPSLACVGRLVTHKRVDRVIDAAGALAERWPGLRLHIVGRGHEEEALAARIAANGLQDVVHLHGYLPEADKNALLAGVDLHVTASEFEGWGLSVIEAASLGVPTVAYDVDGLREAVRDGRTGWLADPAESLADVVERALKEIADPVRKAEVAAACTAWAGRFSWAATGERMARLIRAERSRPVRRRPGGEPCVVHYREGGTEHVVLVENTHPARLRAQLAGAGEIIGIRPASRIELLTGRPGSDQ